MVSETKIADDGYAYNGAAQTSSGPSNVLMPGVYRAEGDLLTRLKDGEPVVQKDDYGNEWPVYVIPSLTVTDENGKATVYNNVWHEIQTKPTNYGDASRDMVSDGAKLLRGLNAEEALSATSFSDAMEKLKAYVGQRITISISTGLMAQDSAWALAEIAKRGLRKPQDYPEINKVWKAAKLNTAAFMVKKGANGVPATYSTTAKGPSGALLSAKIKIAQILPSDVETEYGPGVFPPK
jgi:hypothetical protein